MSLIKKPRHGHDTKCPDGFVCYEWRKVFKGGYVRFSIGKHYHEDLVPHIGRYVYVVLHDMYGINVDIFPEEPWDIKNVIYACNEKQWFEINCLQCRDKNLNAPTVIEKS